MYKHRLLTGMLGLILTAATLAAGSATAADKPELDAVTDPSFVPFEMKDEETGEMVGFDMSILAEVAKRAGFDYDLATMDFNGIIPALQTGNKDIALAGITITDKRAKIVDFSDPYYQSGLRILRHTDDESVQELSDLKGKKVGVKIGSTSYDFLKEEFGDAVELTAYPGSSDMYLALMGDNLDAVFYDAPNVAYFARKKGKGQVETVGPLYQGQDYGIALVEGSKWVDDVNDALAAMKADGTYAEIYKKWFGEAPPDN